MRSEEGEQTAIAEVQLRLRRASPGAACQGPSRRTGQSGGEGDPRVPSDEAVLCTEELRQRQGAALGLRLYLHFNFHFRKEKVL